MSNVQQALQQEMPQPTSATAWPATHQTFAFGQCVEKLRGSQWTGRVVGFYSTNLTPEGYAVESSTEKGSVQIYPASALRPVNQTPSTDYQESLGFEIKMDSLGEMVIYEDGVEKRNATMEERVLWEMVTQR